MNQKKHISASIFVFSKWSRKKYAIFVSLGKLIKIGVLKADVCQKALLKRLISLGHIAEIKEYFGEDETALNTSADDSFQFTLSWLGLSIFPAFNLVSNTISKKGNPLRIILFSEYRVCFLPSVKNRLFFVHNLNLTNN